MKPFASDGFNPLSMVDFNAISYFLTTSGGGKEGVVQEIAVHFDHVFIGEGFNRLLDHLLDS